MCDTDVEVEGWISQGRGFNSGSDLFFINLVGGWLQRNHPGATTQVGVVADGFLKATTLRGSGGGALDVFFLFLQCE